MDKKEFETLKLRIVFFNPQDILCDSNEVIAPDPGDFDE